MIGAPIGWAIGEPTVQTGSYTLNLTILVDATVTRRAAVSAFRTVLVDGTIVRRLNPNILRHVFADGIVTRRLNPNALKRVLVDALFVRVPGWAIQAYKIMFADGVLIPIKNPNKLNTVLVDMTAFRLSGFEVMLTIRVRNYIAFSRSLKMITLAMSVVRGRRT